MQVAKNFVQVFRGPVTEMYFVLYLKGIGKIGNRQQTGTSYKAHVENVTFVEFGEWHVLEYLEIFQMLIFASEINMLTKTIKNDVTPHVRLPKNSHNLSSNSSSLNRHSVVRL